jgi:lysophospholipase L1-like esterase
MKTCRQLFGLMVFVAGLLCFSASFAQDAGDPWQKEIDALVANDATHPPAQHGVLFIGSSSIRIWTTLSTDFPGVPVINRGFGGSMIPDSTRNVGRIVTPYHPKLIIFYAGDNDIGAGHAPTQVVDDFKAFVARVQRDLPDTTIVFLSIKPSVARFALWPQIYAVNESIAQWAYPQAKVKFVDVATPMLDSNGKPRPELLREDGLHMLPAGYAIWIAALKPVLAKYGFATQHP